MPSATTTAATAYITALPALLLALLACCIGALWQHSQTGSPQAIHSHDDFSALFSSLSHSLRRHALVLAPLHVPDDLALHHAVIANLTRDLERIVPLRAAILESHSALSASVEAQFQSLPLLALTSMALQRDHMMKELLREGWAAPGKGIDSDSPSTAKTDPQQRPDYLTPWDVEQFGRRFLVAPLQLMISQSSFDLLRPQRLPHQRDSEQPRSVLTYAVERGLYAAVSAIIARIKQSGACTPDLAALLAAQSKHLRASRFADGDEHMQRLLASDASDVACIFAPQTDSARPASVELPAFQNHWSVPIVLFLREAELESMRSPAPNADLDAGGWRPMPATVALASLESLSTRGCPFPSVPLADLSSYFDRQSKSHSPATPIIITGALVGHWSAVRNFTRNSLLHRWGQQQVEIGRIPYADLFAAAADRVPLAKYFTYLDNLAAEQIKGIRGAKDVQGDDPNLSPWYVFDGLVFQDEAIVAAGWQDTGADDGSSLFRVPSALRAHIRDASVSVVESPQFFLGPAGSGAPLHYHCSAVNGLVFGRKRWFLYPPGEAAYSKLHPRLFLERMARGAYGSAIRPPFACTQNSGDLLFVPAGWSHATLNEHESIGIAVEFDGGGC